MTNAGVLDVLINADAETEISCFQASKQRWARFLLICSVGGVLLGVFGAFINAVSFLGITKSVFLTKLGFWLLVIIFPFAYFLAHCLDKIDEADKQIRLARLKDRGFTEIK